MNNYIYAYYQAIKSGTIIAGKWIIAFYEYIIQGLKNHSFFFSVKKANRAVKFVENFCHHSEGRSDLLKLELWQKAMLSVIFGIVEENGLRYFREIFVVVGRKNGKSLLASAVIEYMLFLDGEYGAKIFCLAPKLEQADLVYNDFRCSVEAEPELNEKIKSRKSDLYVAETQSSVKKIAFNAKKSDGFNPSLVVCDEIASWPALQGLKQYEVMTSALGARRQPMIFNISTSGYVDEGIYDELIGRSTRFLLGNEKNTRLAPFLYMIDDLSKWNNINELQKANPNLGVSVSVDYILNEIAIAESSLSKKAEFMTKHANIKQNSSQAWLNSRDIARAISDPLSIEDFRGCYCVGGIDLSRTTDLTAAVIVIEKNKKLYVFARFYMPAEKIEEASARDQIPYRQYISKGFLYPSGDNFVDYHDCHKFFLSLVRDHEIYPLKTGYDRYTAQYLVQDMKQDGYHMDDVYQGYNLTPVIQEVEGLMKDGVFVIGDNDLLKMHLLDSALKVDTDTEKRKLVKLNPRSHIDGCAALLDAMTVRQKYHDEIGVQLRNED